MNTMLKVIFCMQVAAHLRQLSCTPTEVVAESFCHLVTIPNEKLMDLRAFYG